MTAASIITIGDELLIGQVIDTNSAWIAQELNKLGIAVKRRIAVGDIYNEIWQALDEESRHSDVILITGGLGPTADDITKPLLCEYFGGKMILNQKVLAHVTYLFEQVFKRPITERNARQADVPDVCTVIHNAYGTAPAMQFEKEGHIYISMPGVPHEMKGIMTDHVLPMLQKHYQLPAIIHKTLVTFGIGESFLADLIEPFETALPSHIKLAYLPNMGMIRLRLSTSGTDQLQTEREITAQFDQLKILVKDYLVTDRDESMNSIVARLLMAQNATVSTAESCTGGYIAHLITLQPGSSEYFKGSVVSYSNEAKTNVLNIQPSALQQDGAVSEATVQQMVKGILQTMHTDYAIAVSGIMGPGGETPGKPVGSVWIAVGNAAHIETQSFKFTHSRQMNIERTAINALNMLRRFIINNPQT